MPDRTDVLPVRRMSVARGVLRFAADAPDADCQAGARVAAILAAKQSHILVPSSMPFQATDAFCDIAVTGSVAETTMTVQGYARTPISTAALAGATAALLTLREQVGGRIAELDIVQDVEL